MLYIRFKQAYRMALDIGPWLSIAVLLLALHFLINAFVGFISEKSVFYVGGFVFFVFSIHLGRNDGVFLKTAHIDEKKVYWAEYGLLSAPVALCALFSPQPWAVFALLPLAATAWIRPVGLRKQGIARPMLLLPPALFEWVAGFRRHGLWMFALYIGGLVWLFFSPGGLVFFTPILLGICGFYTEGESWQLLMLQEMPPKRFLWFKMRIALKAAGLLWFPYALFFTILYPQYFYAVVLSTLLSVFLLLFVIAAKYAQYEPDRPLRGVVIYLGLAVACLLVPFLFLVPIGMFIRFLSSSLKNISPYLSRFEKKT